jgi:hypothetical protein
MVKYLRVSREQERQQITYVGLLRSPKEEEAVQKKAKEDTDPDKGKTKAYLISSRGNWKP